MPDKFAHCTFCGARFTPGQRWPRRCAACGETSYLNPKPVAVVLQPVSLQPAGPGLLVVRGGAAPARDRPALPGGYIGVGETWQEGAVRELAAETGLRASPTAVRLFDASSSPDGTLLIFGLLPPVAPVPWFTGGESAGCEVIEKPIELAFELHTRATERWFATR